jgi:immunity protein 52 of polymorphic toxin system
MIPISEGGPGAYWTARKESVESCADRLRLCLRSLATLSPAFASWFYTKERTRLPASTDPQFLRELLLAGRNRKDFPPREIIEELGFTASFITDSAIQEQVNFLVACGMYAKDPALLNHCLLKFAPAGTVSYDSVPLELKTRALAVLIESWDPDWAALRSRRLSKAVQAAHGNAPIEPYFGWICYVSQRRGAPSEEVREKYHCKSLSDRGNMIYVTQEAFDDRNPALLQAAADLYSLLLRDGLLNRNSPFASSSPARR